MHRLVTANARICRYVRGRTGQGTADQLTAQGRCQRLGASCWDVFHGAEERRVAVNFQLVMDCTDPERLSRFWAAALRYELEPPPEGFATWDDYWRDVGVPDEDLGIGADCIIDPDGAGPRIWFQVVPEAKFEVQLPHRCSSGTVGRVGPYRADAAGLASGQRRAVQEHFRALSGTLATAPSRI
jgi:Glyoxalase-like domain